MYEMINSTWKKMKKDIALKSSTHNGDDDENEEVVLLSRKLQQFLVLQREGIAKAPKHESNDVMNSVQEAQTFDGKLPAPAKFKCKKTMCATWDELEGCESK